jgi:cyclopropane-fatty-acyl-phospholipid synthase
MNPTLCKRLVEPVLRHVRGGTLTIIEPDGVTHHYGRGPIEAVMRLRDRSVWRDFLGGSLALSDSYAEGLWDSPDPVALVRLAARNMPPLDRARRIFSPILHPLELSRSLRRPRGRDQRRQDVIAHYDLGNALFQRMLDPTLTYSCAIFDRPDASLEQAQIAKLERVCEQLRLGPQDHVIEIGTGWGSFAIHAASTRGCRVTTTTISQEQYEYAVRRVRDAGLSDLVSVINRDFRDLEGKYDKLVSIEMIEAVGWQNLGRFMGHCSRLLKPDGAMLLQAITIDDRAYHVEKASRSFIKEYIFPGGALPSLEVLTRSLARRTNMQTLDVTDITVHYVETLRRWRDRFLASWPELEALGYDERFRRIWTLYLAYCEGGFAERRIQDVQLLLAKPDFRGHIGGVADAQVGEAIEHAR